MNSLSWFLYLSEVVANLGSIASGVVVGGVLVVCMLGAFFPLICMFLEDTSIEPKAIAARVAKPAIIIWSVCLVASAVIPSKNTMYAIAASEVGERVAANKEVHGMASDAAQALRQWIQKQIEPEAKK